MDFKYTLQAWIEAFTIFSKYVTVAEVSAEHDEIFAGPPPEIVSKDDSARLIELGWRPDEKQSCFRKFV